MCEKCDGRGLIITGPDSARPCDCMKTIASQNKLKTAAVPGGQVVLSDFDLRYYSQDKRIPETNKTYYQAAKDALVSARAFVHTPVSGLALVGEVGRGKTFLACCIAHELLAKGEDIIFIVVPDLLAEIRETYNSDSARSELQVLENARKVKVLFLDDLGAHNYTDWVLNQLYLIINYRINNSLPTVITSNLTIDQMYDKLGDRITSRIRALCEVHFIGAETDIRTAKSPKRIGRAV